MAEQLRELGATTARPMARGGVRIGARRAHVLHVVRVVVFEVVLVLMGIAMLLPFIWLISGSVKSEGEVFAWPPVWIPTHFYWDNYPKALTLMPFAIFFRNTITIAVLSTVGTTISASLAAFAFARLRFPGRGPLFVLVLATMMLPSIVTMIPRFILFKHLGWVDTLKPLWVPEFFGGNAFSIFLLRQFFLTLPVELDEAARIDGASNWRIWATIALPLAVPALATVAVFAFINAWNDFMGPLIYLNSMDKRTISLGLAAFMGPYSAEYNLMLAASVSALLPVLFVFFLAQRLFVKGIVLSGLTGR